MTSTSMSRLLTGPRRGQILLCGCMSPKLPLAKELAGRLRHIAQFEQGDRRVERRPGLRIEKVSHFMRERRGVGMVRVVGRWGGQGGMVGRAEGAGRKGGGGSRGWSRHGVKSPCWVYRSSMVVGYSGRDQVGEVFHSVAGARQHCVRGYSRYVAPHETRGLTRFAPRTALVDHPTCAPPHQTDIWGRST